jgi:hypothetical protein
VGSRDRLPAYSIYNDAQDRQRIFDGVFDIKRLQPGLITAKDMDGVVKHGPTTLGGNSGCGSRPRQLKKLPSV